MFIKKGLSKKAQVTAEYAVLIALVVGAVVAMQVYTKRGLQGRIKDAVDHKPVDGQTMEGSAQAITWGTDQYEPYYIRHGAYNMTTTSSEGTEEGTIKEDGSVRTLTGAIIAVKTKTYSNVDWPFRRNMLSPPSFLLPKFFFKLITNI